MSLIAQLTPPKYFQGRLLLNNMSEDNIQPKNTSLEDTKFQKMLKAAVKFIIKDLKTNVTH